MTPQKFAFRPYFVIVLGFMFLLMFLFQGQIYRMFPNKTINEKYKTELINLGSKAILSKDIPIASILTYKDSIIGRGYNTVKRDNNITGHAEINALNDAFCTFGNDFYALDKSKLKLYSTLEPCPMCKGVLVNQNIYNVYFEMDKPLLKRTKNTLKNLYYEFCKREITDENMQDSLVNLFHKTHELIAK